MPLVSVLRQNVILAPGSQVFNSSGNFTVPPAVTSLVICICGGGGSGGGDNSHRGGGGGGSGVKKVNVAVTPGEVIQVTVAAGQSYTATNGLQANSSIFFAASGTITAQGGFSAGSLELPGLGANGGGNGGDATEEAGELIICDTATKQKGFNSSATCDGNTRIGGNGFCTSNFGIVFFSGGGGAGGFGNGAQSAQGTGAPSAGSPNSGAGGGGSWVNQGNGATGGSGKCIVYWGGAHPPVPSPI